MPTELYYEFRDAHKNYIVSVARRLQRMPETEHLSLAKIARILEINAPVLRRWLNESVEVNQVIT